MTNEIKIIRQQELTTIITAVSSNVKINSSSIILIIGFSSAARTTVRENQNVIQISSFLTVNKDNGRLIGKLGDQQVAVKKFDDQNSLRKEVAILAKLKHSNVLQLLFQCEGDAQQLLLITENYDFALSDVANPKDLNEVQVMTHLTNAVEYLQEKHKIAHLDIAPENIVIEKCGSELIFKLTNFKFARIISNNSAKVSFYNRKHIDRAYTPPELRDKSQAFSTSDCWSLGRVLLLLTCGDFQITKKNLRKDPYEIVIDKMEKISSKQKSLQKNLLSKILIKSEQKRLSAAKMLEHPFFWSAKDTLYFIVDVSKSIEASNAFRTEIFKGCKKVMMGDDWTKRIPNELNAAIQISRQAYNAKIGGKQDSVDGTKITSLIQNIRNLIVHSNSPEIEEIVGKTEEDFLNYWKGKFPFLIEHLYETKCRFDDP